MGAMLPLQRVRLYCRSEGKFIQHEGDHAICSKIFTCLGCGDQRAMHLFPKAHEMKTMAVA